MPNRKARRQMKVEDLTRADVILRNLVPSAFAPARRGTRSFSVVAKTDFELWVQVVMGTLHNLGIADPQWKVGYLLDFLNTQPVEVRRMLAASILQGIGMTVFQKPGEKEGEMTLEVQFDKMYDSLISPEQKRPGGLWVPGDDPPVV